MSIDTKGLALLIQEANDLSKKPRLTGQEERRNAWLLASISTLKHGGVTLVELDQEYVNERSRAAGMPTVQLPKPLTASQKEIRSWQAMVRGEHRDMGDGGNLSSQIGTYSGLGYFVPTDFYPQLFVAMAAHDALYDPENVTFISSTNGRPLPVPTAGDTENVATLTGEAGTLVSTDICEEGHVALGAYSFSSPRFVISLEAMQDLEQSFTAVELAKRFFSDRLARGIGNYLINGTGSGQPTGLLTALESVTPITAQGSAANTGGNETGATSLGSVDFAAAYEALDAAYLASPKCAWAMSNKTLGYLLTILDKYGNPLRLVQFVDGVPTIYGKNVIVCPSMPSVGASQIPVVLGDFSYFATRITTDDSTGIKTFTEAPGLAENGKVALRTFLRADSNVLWTDTSSPCPFVPIRNHS